MRFPVALHVSLAAWAGLAASAASAQVECPPDVVPLAEATPVSGTGASCYRFQIPEASPFVRFDVDAAEGLDLYFSEGLQQSLTDWDRINVGPIEGDAKFVLLHQSPGDYTVAVAPESAAAAYRLSASAGVLDDEEPLTVCIEDVCNTALPMKTGPQAIQLGSEFGDRVIFPLTVGAPGTLEVRAHWSGSAGRLALILNGPPRPGQVNPVAAYARNDGASPLLLRYTVTAEDLERGRRFQVSLVNFAGGEALGGIDIQTPKTMVFTYARFAKRELVPVQPRKLKAVPSPAPVVVQPRRPVVARPMPGPIRPVKSEEEVCREGVQGKVAWDYQGSTSWSPANVERLCRGTTKGSEPARCFRQVMHGGVEWGGGTRWQWENAIDLCEGTSNALRTLRCFEAAIRRGRPWRDAIRACETR